MHTVVEIPRFRTRLMQGLVSAKKSTSWSDLLLICQFLILLLCYVASHFHIIIIVNSAIAYFITKLESSKDVIFSHTATAFLALISSWWNGTNFLNLLTVASLPPSYNRMRPSVSMTLPNSPVDQSNSASQFIQSPQRSCNPNAFPVILSSL